MLTDLMKYGAPFELKLAPITFGKLAENVLQLLGSETMSIVIIWNAVSERPLEAGLWLATVLTGTPLYLLWRWFRGRRQTKGSTP